MQLASGEFQLVYRSMEHEADLPLGISGDLGELGHGEADTDIKKR